MNQTQNYLMKGPGTVSDSSSTSAISFSNQEEKTSARTKISREMDFGNLDRLLKDSEKNWTEIMESLSGSMSKSVIRKLKSDFKKILNSNEWQFDDIPITKESMHTFKQLFDKLNPSIAPSISSDHGGNIVLFWGGRYEHISFTCFNNNTAIFYFSYENTNNKFVDFCGHKHINDIIDELNNHDLLKNKFLVKQNQSNKESLKNE